MIDDTLVVFAALLMANPEMDPKEAATRAIAAAAELHEAQAEARRIAKKLPHGELSVRAGNVLKRAFDGHMPTPAEVAKQGGVKLLRVLGCGDTTTEEIRQWLRQQGFELST
mgnify:CR=1